MTWTPPTNAVKREAEKMAEFHRWTRIGDAVIGRISRFGSNDYGDFAELSPAISYPAGRRPAACAELAVGLSANLRRQISQGQLGRIVGIRFTDKQQGGKGLYNVFEVYELAPETLREYLAKLNATELLHEAPAESLAEPENEDGLPF